MSVAVGQSLLGNCLPLNMDRKHGLPPGSGSSWRPLKSCTDTDVFCMKNNTPLCGKRENQGLQSSFAKRSTKAETFVKTSSSICDLESSNPQRSENHYGVATAFPTSVTARGSLEDNITSLLAQMDSAHHSSTLQLQSNHGNIPLLVRSGTVVCNLPGQQNNTISVNDSAYLMSVPPSFKIEDHGCDTRKITLESNLPHANFSTSDSEHMTSGEGSAKPLSSHLIQSKGRQEIVPQSLQIEGMWYYLAY